MASLPRIITVDPTWTIARIVRTAMDLMDYPIVQVDVPSGTEALEELGRGKVHLVVTALELHEDMKGFELALRIKQAAPDTQVMILAEIDDPQDLDEETQADSPFIYMHRPVDLFKFLKVLTAGLRGENILDALSTQTITSVAPIADLGPVPPISLEAAQTIIDQLLTDVGAMAVVFSNRTGQVLLERGAVGYLNREQLTGALLPMVETNLGMGGLVGGRASSLQFYDGESYDVFVISVGLHHYLCLIFDGQAGNRQFGAVNRFGRRASEDLVALLGASAFVLQDAKAPADADVRPERKKRKTGPLEDEAVAPVAVRETAPVSEPEPLRLDPIEKLDESIFEKLGSLDVSAADDLFDMDKLAEIAANAARSREQITFDEASELGIVRPLADQK